MRDGIGLVQSHARHRQPADAGHCQVSCAGHLCGRPMRHGGACPGCGRCLCGGAGAAKRRRGSQKCGRRSVHRVGALKRPGGHRMRAGRQRVGNVGCAEVPHLAGVLSREAARGVEQRGGSASSRSRLAADGCRSGRERLPSAHAVDAAHERAAVVAPAPADPVGAGQRCRVDKDGADSVVLRRPTPRPDGQAADPEHAG
mmetsp:Transcript_22851/g.86532  ORF Transcript_22851/g.86532 Transcript_22851/m.86532 type:complete len:200 (+) Transcript_22851:1975-2574(+)